jgi:ABC-type transport system involved in multi-copper enzyme maturation permease subunit
MSRTPIPENTHEGVSPSAWRAWWFLVWLSWQRQARAHLMVWIALGLLALTLFIVGLSTQMGLWNRAFDRWPEERGRTYAQHLLDLEQASALAWQPPDSTVRDAVLAGYRASVYEGSSFYVFSRWIVFEVVATFLLPLWSIAFATEGVGREREAQNLLWVLTRPLPRPAIFLAKYVALLPWCLALNLGGFALICLAGGYPGRMALALYWPAVFWGTLAFAALFHTLAAAFRHSAMLALLYSFFIETVVGNLPRDLKRFSLSFYMRSMMYDEARGLGIGPENPLIYQTVSGTTAWLVLAAATAGLLIVGCIVFSRREYLDVG